MPRRHDQTGPDPRLSPQPPHSTPDYKLPKQRPPETYGTIHRFSLKLLGIETPVALGPGNWPKELEMAPGAIHWKQVRAGDRLFLGSTPFFVEWVRIDDSTPPAAGKIIESAAKWERTVLLTPDSPREWWGDLGAVDIE